MHLTTYLDILCLILIILGLWGHKQEIKWIKTQHSSAISVTADLLEKTISELDRSVAAQRNSATKIKALDQRVLVLEEYIKKFDKTY